jgi:predicted Holliday junction resolvase-like endonuclease
VTLPGFPPDAASAATGASAGATAFVLALVVGLVALVVLLFLLGLSMGRRRGRLEAERDLVVRVEKEREDAVKRSRAVLAGQAAEQLAPWLPGFPFDPGDCRFIGKPVDFLVFTGSTAGAISEVIFVEVKSGSAGLNKTERSLREAVEAGRVRWQEYRAP